MSPTCGRHHHSSTQPLHTQDQPHSQHRSRAHIPGRSHSPIPHRQSRSKGRGRNPEEGSPNTLMGRELSRALNKASERGTQGKEM